VCAFVDMLYFLPLHESLVVIKSYKIFETDDDTQFHETKSTQFPSRYLWLATLKLGMKQGILEGETRPQIQGDFE